MNRNERIELETRWKINDTGFSIHPKIVSGKPLANVRKQSIVNGEEKPDLLSLTLTHKNCMRRCRHSLKITLFYFILFIQWQIIFAIRIKRFRVWAGVTMRYDKDDIDCWPYIRVMYLLPLANPLSCSINATYGIFTLASHSITHSAPLLLLFYDVLRRIVLQKDATENRQANSLTLSPAKREPQSMEDLF